MTKLKSDQLLEALSAAEKTEPYEQMVKEFAQKLRATGWKAPANPDHTYSTEKVKLISDVLQLYEEAITRMPTGKLRKWVTSAVRYTAYDSSISELQEWITLLRKDMEG